MSSSARAFGSAARPSLLLPVPLPMVVIYHRDLIGQCPAVHVLSELSFGGFTCDGCHKNFLRL